jgi:hypothetical protein
MLFIVGLLILSVAVVVIRRRPSPGWNTAPLGLMSEQWLAEQRSSHSL